MMPHINEYLQHNEDVKAAFATAVASTKERLKELTYEQLDYVKYRARYDLVLAAAETNFDKIFADAHNPSPTEHEIIRLKKMLAAKVLIQAVDDIHKERSAAVPKIPAVPPLEPVTPQTSSEPKSKTEQLLFDENGNSRSLVDIAVNLLK